MNKPTDEQMRQLRVRIAELRGWHHIHETGNYGLPDYIEEKGDTPLRPINMWVIPDFTGDLNAIHEAEDRLMVNNFVNEWLEAICMVVNGFPYDEGYWEHSVAIARAEAWQRCIALDRALRKDPIL